MFERASPFRHPIRVTASILRCKFDRFLADIPFDDFGTRIVADLRTPLGKQLYRYGAYRDQDFAVLQETLTEGDVFVDCGANVGQFSLTAGRIVGGRGRVLAFEPVPGTCEALRRNIAANGWAHVDVHQCALGATDAEDRFVSMGVGSGLSSFAPEERELGIEIAVSVRRLDDYIEGDLAARVRLVKIDVEGSEVRLLRGAERLLSEIRPVFLVEVEDAHLRRQGSSASELVEVFNKHGFEMSPSPGAGPNFVFRPTT